ncbi:hypothetical protein Hypma_011301 [Hypsizygus marmoreus]|uniref:Uncharacterized protein n=1 Tax=Hypsizygus marmoreus TaxID=39966 RepID=A0A369JM65_HYPMA|nr:hypothetical protein Hypma_011301 [Hypsizygus marmoreus]
MSDEAHTLTAAPNPSNDGALPQYGTLGDNPQEQLMQLLNEILTKINVIVAQLDTLNATFAGNHAVQANNPAPPLHPNRQHKRYRGAVQQH